MPRVRGFTPEQQRLADGERILRYIQKKCHTHRLRSLTGLADALDINYNALYSSLRTGSIRAVTMMRIIKALDMTNEDVLVLMGRK